MPRPVWSVWPGVRFRLCDAVVLDSMVHGEAEQTRIMKPNTTCRNCGGKEFYSHEVNAKGHMDLLPIGYFSGGKFRLRVCGGCGLADWFVSDEYLPKVREKFSRE